LEWEEIYPLKSQKVTIILLRYQRGNKKEIQNKYCYRIIDMYHVGGLVGKKLKIEGLLPLHCSIINMCGKKED
jgi:hypothetical protein